MIRQVSKSLGCIFISLFSIHAFAADTIKITVKTMEKNAVAIGFTVDNKEFGTLGKSYSGRGPKDKEYYFGYKKDSLFGDNISCGSLTLTQDSTIVLMVQDNKCYNIPG
ncbi:hypothetical protein [Legionella bononiensis]|uniref:Secreted protein n=1 Tax=Legionella bononiensis TaxID=2793102 RepID=A0ABS1WEH2_9GAMM|nr:hypothetical protein [Legionella bononiensis]MBL7479379.1 hypothetical protein [Legionella bononiensis]MBL7527747.1 hypothetical protein [Legionella bononiensis]MBL7563570.1 hypothetical protein [Legionella bononiensis]